MGGCFNPPKKVNSGIDSGLYDRNIVQLATVVTIVLFCIPKIWGLKIKGIQKGRLTLRFNIMQQLSICKDRETD